MSPSKNTWRNRGFVLEHARPGDAGPPHADAGQQFAPAACGFGVRHIHGLGVERELSRAQPGDRCEALRSVVDLDQQVLAFLSRHGSSFPLD
jgi:hypothetical protein